MADTFDPKKFLAETAPAPETKSASSVDSFDPKKFLAETAPVNPRPKLSAGEAFVHGMGQGASFGFADEGAAALGALRDKAQAALGMRGDISLSDAYNSYLPHLRAEMVDRPMADQKGAFIGGNIAGGLALAIPGAAGALAGRGAIAAGEVATAGTAAKVAPGIALGTAKAALRGAVYGGVTGAGTSDANLTKGEVGEFAKDVGKGAATGAVADSLFSLVGRAAKAVTPTSLRETSNKSALKAAGALGSDTKKLGPEGVQAVGEEIHKAGLQAFDTIEEVGAKISAAKEDAGQAIGAALDSVDSLVVKAKSAVDAGNMPQAAKDNLKAQIDKTFQFNLDRVGQRIEEEIIKPNLIANKTGELAPVPTLKGEIGKLQALAENFKQFGSVSMREGNVIKGTQGRMTRFNSETVPEEFKKEVYGIIKTELDNIVGKTGNLELGVGKMAGNALGEAGDVAARNQSVSEAYGAAKKAYGGLAKAEQINTMRQGSQAGNRAISLTDTIAAVSPLGLAGGVANKAIRTFGSSVQAVGTRRAADLMEKAPAVLGKFYPVLEAAAKNGVAALTATHVKLLKDPDYQRILENADRTQAIQRRVNGGH